MLLYYYSSAFWTVIAYPSGIGSFHKCSTSASRNTLPTSHPLQIRSIAAEITLINRWTSCSAHICTHHICFCLHTSAHITSVSASVIATPYQGPPFIALHDPLNFCIVLPVSGSSLLTRAHTHGSSMVIHWSTLIGSPNIPVWLLPLWFLFIMLTFTSSLIAPTESIGRWCWRPCSQT